MSNFTGNNKAKLINVVLGIYWLILFIATTLPGKDLPKTGIGDKTEHFTAYGILSVLLSLSMMFQDKYFLIKKHFALAALTVISVYAALDELHQLFIPGRSCDILDWSADFIGASIGILIVTFFFKKIGYKPREN